MLPARSTLLSWNPDSLSTSATAIESAAARVSTAVTGINHACQELPEMKSWSGRSHDAAAAMFLRAERDALKFSGYANAVAAALSSGAESIGSARRLLLAKADEVDAGPLNVTDQWVVRSCQRRRWPDCKRWRQRNRTPSTACSSRSATLTMRLRMVW